MARLSSATYLSVRGLWSRSAIGALVVLQQPRNYGRAQDVSNPPIHGWKARGSV
jgi:hypothetical protein